MTQRDGAHTLYTGTPGCSLLQHDLHAPLGYNPQPRSWEESQCGPKTKPKAVDFSLNWTKSIQRTSEKLNQTKVKNVLLLKFLKVKNMSKRM